MKKYIFIALGATGLCITAVALWAYVVLSHLPDVSVLKRYRPSACAEVLDKDGAALTQYFDRKFRIWVPLAGIPDIVIKSVVTAEDDTFFEHHGVNYKATWDALVQDVQKHRYARGGSTITQQMIKNVLLSKQNTIVRKLREYILARRAEEILTKRRILEIYLNEVEWGDNIYGIEAASRYYFDKHASELAVPEAALLAGMLPNPRYFNPLKRPGKARDRQERVLFNLQQAKLISQDEYAAALAQPIALRQEGKGRFDLSALANRNGRPCWQHALEETLAALYGDQELYCGGLTIRTSIDRSLQDALNLWETPFANKDGKSPERVSVVLQDGLVRAFVCAGGKEAELREKLATSFSGQNYTVKDTAPDAISREQIIPSSLPTGTAAH